MIILEWYNLEKTIIYWKFAAGSSLDEALDSFRLFGEMVSTVKHKTYTIIDFTEGGQIPPNILSRFPEMSRLLPKGDKQSEQVAVVSNSKFLEALMSLFGKMYYDRFVYFDTVEAAAAHFQQRLSEEAV